MMRKLIVILGLTISLSFIVLYFLTPEEKKLPIIGFDKLVERQVNGQTVVDTLEHTIPDFTFVNQDSTIVTEATVEGKVYLADMFFTSCPTICPKVKKNMKMVYEQFKTNPDFAVLSHSIDTKYDTVGRLAWYAKKLDIDSKNWHLLTGDKDAIFNIAKEYYIAALVAEDAPGGFDHSGAVALVDRKRRIRGLYDGTDPKKMEELAEDLAYLLNKRE